MQIGAWNLFKLLNFDDWPKIFQTNRLAVHVRRGLYENFHIFFKFDTNFGRAIEIEVRFH